MRISLRTKRTKYMAGCLGRLGPVFLAVVVLLFSAVRQIDAKYGFAGDNDLTCRCHPGNIPTLNVNELKAGEPLANSTGELQGSVTDANGAALVSTKLTAVHLSNGIERSVNTDANGFYQFVKMPVGAYRLTVQLRGFRTKIIESVLLEVGRTAVLNLSLSVGDISEQVRVESSTSPVDLASVAAGTTINERTVQEIPLNGRYFIDLGSLGPGSVTPPQNGAFSGPTRGGGALMMVTAGNREDTVNFQINGVTLNDQVNNTIIFNPPITSVREFKIDNSTFSAEFGRSSGALVNVATQSGTKNLHGEVFEYFRNNALDARNFFNFTSSQPPPFKRNQFGFAVGGPLVLPRFGEGGGRCS